MSQQANNAEHDPWTDLTWDDLERWAGAKIVHRGRNYHESGRVLEIARPTEHLLVGTVIGTRLYTTRVTLHPDNPTTPLSCECSCPYWDDCKHAVALILEYLDKVASGEEVPATISGSDGDEAALDGLLHDDEAADDDARERDAAVISEYLDALDRAELIDLVHELVGAGSDSREVLLTRARISQGDVDSIVRDIEKELRQLKTVRAPEETWQEQWARETRWSGINAGPPWADDWEPDIERPDYTYLEKRLDDLLSAGEPDAVLRLGQEAFELATSHVEMFDEDWQVAREAHDCLEPVWKAVERSSLGLAQRMLWLIDRLVADEYELCDAQPDSDLWQADSTTWGEVADALLDKFEDADPDEQPRTVGWGQRRRRSKLTDWTLRALDAAGRHEEALELCLREARVTHSYDRAVERLIAAGRLDEARKLALEGISRTKGNIPNYAATLEDRLRQISSLEGDAATVAAHTAEEFLEDPSPEGYRDLQQAATEAGVWSRVRVLVLEGLETGTDPTGDDRWPLPDTEVPRGRNAITERAPWAILLTQIALYENDPERALKWLREVPLTEGDWQAYSLLETVAEQVASTHPDDAIAIWHWLAITAIAEKSRSAYERAMQYLRPIRDLLTGLDRRDEWDELLQQLRTDHSRKRALLQTLDLLRDEPIVDT